MGNRLFTRTIIALFLASLLASQAWGFHTPITALGFTQEEKDIWVARAASGPYKTKSDVSTNSPGDWDRIKANADAFSFSNWTSWNAETGCMDGSIANPGPSRDVNLKDAAFAWFITGTTSYLTAVTNALITYSQQAGMDFTNTSLWCADGSAVNQQPIFDAANWLIKLVIAYDFIRADISAGNRATLDAWFQGMTHFSDRVAAAFEPGEAWPFYSDHLNGNFTLTGTGSTQFNTLVTQTSSEQTITHFGGYNVSQGQQVYNNRLGVIAALGGLVGVMFDDSDAINKFKAYVKEAIQFATFPDGTYYEFNRWLEAAPPLGLGYAAAHWCFLTVVIDALARNGDFDLYNYSTSNGSGGTGGTTSAAGGPKTFRTIMTMFSNFVIPSVTRYIPGHNGEANYRIDTVDEVFGESKAHDVWISMPNLYWRDTTIKSIYLRDSGPIYPASLGSGERFWGGTQGFLPGFMMMFGDLEGVVFPYPSKLKVW